MSLLWSVPVVAAALATVVVALAARPLSDEAAGVAADVRRLRELRRPLGAVRSVLAETGDLAARRSADRAADGPEGDRDDGHGPGTGRRGGAPLG